MVLNPGTSGDLFQIATSGIGQADGIFSYDNQEPASIFYGTAANGWGPTSTGVGEFTAIKAETYAPPPTAPLPSHPQRCGSPGRDRARSDHTGDNTSAITRQSRVLLT